jgi:4'-phosphopantetheinyl transferase
VDVYWLEQTQADVPADNDWLSSAETFVMNGLRFEKRRNDWRLGRWTGKRALATFLNLPGSGRALAEIEICAGQTGAPEVLLYGAPAAVSISLSHRAGRAMCVVSASAAALGCDLEIIEPRTDGFVADYFVTEERELVARAAVSEQFKLLALMWSAKESALKALRTGLRSDTRSVVVMPVDDAADVNGWSRMKVQCSDGRIFLGWWQGTDNVMRTMVADPPPPPPILLDVLAYPLKSFSFCASRAGS